MLNDIFDIFNSRRVASAIFSSNWAGRKKKLEMFLFILDETEKMHEENDSVLPSVMFMSETTIQGWRLSVKSLISFIEEMLDASIDRSLYDYPFEHILTAKFNQDPVEVLFRNLFSSPECYCNVYVLHCRGSLALCGRLTDTQHALLGCIYSGYFRCIIRLQWT